MQTLFLIMVVFGILSVVYNSDGLALIAKGALWLLIGGGCIILAVSILPIIFPFACIMGVLVLLFGKK